MSEPKVLNTVSDDAYIADLAAYTSPFTTLGFFVLSVLPFLETDSNATERLILGRLDEISRQIRELRALFEQRLAELTLRERTGEVLGIQEAVEEFVRLRSQGILDNVTTDSAVTKRKILGYIADAETPIGYYHAYNSLLCTLIPLRIWTFFFFGRPRRDLVALVCGELRDLLANRERGTEVARTLGRNRVSGVSEELILIDELGPVWGTTFTIKVDGKVVYSETFAGIRQIPRRNIADMRRESREKREELAERYAELMSEDVRRCYDAADALSRAICA